MTLEFSVKNQLLGMKRLSTIVSDTINYFEATFDFLTTDWDDCVKTAHFTDGTTVYDIVLVDDAIPASAGLNLTAGVWTVYVHGNKTDYRITTGQTTFTVDQSGVIDGEPLPEVSLTFEEQLLLAAQESLYDLAVANGYEGTLEQWLSTLTGADGNGIASVELTATNGLVKTYTITFDDETTTTFDVTDGTNGSAGANAYVHIKYSATNPTQNSDMTDTPSAYIGIYSGTSATAPTAYTSYTWYLWSGSGSVSHNGTTGLQGGTTNQYYHLTQAQVAPATTVVSTSANGLSPQATAPASGLRNVLAIDNGETARSDKALFDATSPSTQAFGDAAAVGTAMTVARIDHKHAMPTAGIANGNAVKIDAADVADDDFARFTANGLEGRSPAEVLADIGAQAKATITENTDAAPALGTIANNTEYRCTHGTPTAAPTMTIASIAANTTEFVCNVIYKAKSSGPSAPAVTNNSGKTIKYQGDAVVSGTFTPVASTVYRLGWVWDGIYLNCYIKGVA